MAELLLIVRIAGERVALPAGEVECVVDLEDVVPVPRTAPHVAGLAALRSRVLTVIDARVSLGGKPTDSREAVVVPADGHAFALVVDAVEDVVEAEGALQPAAVPLAPGWSRVARGTVEAGGGLVLVLDPQALVTGPIEQAAA